MPDTPQPDNRRLFELLCQPGLQPVQSYTFVQELKNMAAANLISRFESKLDAKIDAQNAKIDALRWVIGIGFVGLGILIAVLRVLG